MSFYRNRIFQLSVVYVIGFLTYPTFILVRTDFSSFVDSLVPEAIGIFITVFLIDLGYRTYEDNKLKQHLIERLGSRNNIVAVTAAEELWAYKWWKDGSLRYAQLERADLRGVDFGKANLTGACLKHPRYGEATFDEKSIMPDETCWTPDTDIDQFTDPNHPNYWKGFNLSHQDLRGRLFSYANLRNADIRNSNLCGVRFKGADMRGVQLQNSKVTGAVMVDTMFDENTVMPDGNNWDPNLSLEDYGVIINED